MEPDITEAVTEWDTVSVSPGYGGLHSLAADEFTGAVTAGIAWAFFLNGRIVGVFDGDIEAFDDADLTAYRAPDPALSLLFAMQELGGETRAQYYSQDTALEAADRTLSAGNFTGYVELSENVLSGDYYVVYHGGHSMSVAFVGASQQLVTGEEAFDLANDEVGIFEVTDVPIEIVEIPGEDSTAAVGTAPIPTETDDEAEVSGAESDTDDAVDSLTDPSESDAEASGSAASADVTFGGFDGGATPTDGEDAVEGETVAEAAEATDGDDDVAVGDDDGDSPDLDERSPLDSETDAEEEPDNVDEANEVEARTTDTSDEPWSNAETETDIDADTTAETDVRADADTETHAEHGIAADTDTAAATDATEPEPPRESGGEQSGNGTSDVFSKERQWQEARTIPPLDPAEAELSDTDSHADPDDDSAADTDDETLTSTRRRARAQGEGGGWEDRTAEDRTKRASRLTDSEASALRERFETLRATLESTTAERDELAARVADLEAELETILTDRDDYRTQVAALESKVDELREERDRLEASGATPASSTGTGSALSPQAARDGTNLFVRYRSKGKPTLEKAHAGEAEQQDVIENLRLEHHTTFESEGVTVEGRPFDEFLHETVEWGFVQWVVEDLLYEIGRSGNRSVLADIFDSIPAIDRVQFQGEVPVTVEEDGERTHEARQFDLVFWDTMGDPLFVADLNTERNATTGGMVGSLIQGARHVGDAKETFSGAFYVTSSFFEPDALDAVGEETSGGLLSRSKRKSFVKLSRKQGYHLCLVEARSDEYHLSVPEL